MSIDENSLRSARTTFATLCAFLDERDWKYAKDEANLVVNSGARGEDLPMDIRFKVDAETQRVILYSQLPFTVPASKNEAVAVAVCTANDNIITGSFDYNPDKGVIVFRVTNTFMESLLGKDVFEYMLGIACYTVDEYNDKLFTLTQRDISLEEVYAMFSE